MFDLTGNDYGPDPDPPADTPARSARRRHSPWLWVGLAMVGTAGLAGAVYRAVDRVREAAEWSQ
ncbi:MAG: hypothetical protein K2X87_10620 [Gemmataceae bacterium]|nr:hypothetical protein [Gemmataceae bacterium]